MPTPPNHIVESLKLTSDAEIDLYELTPPAGGTVFFKADGEITWRGQLYESIPCVLTGEEVSSDKTATPKFVIGQEDVDLLPFKALVFDGHLDGATVVRRRLLLDDLMANRNIADVTYFRVKRVEQYIRTKISLVLATFSASTYIKIPFRQYVTPDFPWVDI